jgi:hypothetical protein
VPRLVWSEYPNLWGARSIMARIIRVKINWTGGPGGAGYTNLHFEPTAGGDITQAVVDNAVTKTNTWIAAFRNGMPNTVTTGVDSNVIELDENYGTIHAFWTATPPAAAAGASVTAYAAGSGACVNWSTDGVSDGRRVRGRTFIDNSGVARLVVWKRPTIVLGEPLPDGGAYDVTSYSINDKVAQLRSRRS